MSENNNSNDPKYITFNQQKGGTGKSTITVNVAKYAAYELDKKVLVIDGDQSCNATLMLQMNNESVDKKNLITNYTVAEIIKENYENVKIHKIDDNIDLIAGFSELDKIQNEIEKSVDENKYAKFFAWIVEKDEFLKQYDYVLIDTHNGFDLFQKNAVIVSDVVIEPDRPDMINEYTNTNMDFRIEDYKTDFINPNTGESFITARIYKVGNMINGNEKLDIKFLKNLKSKEEYLTWIPNKKAFLQAVVEDISMKDILKKNGNSRYDRKFYKRYVNAMESILNG